MAFEPVVSRDSVVVLARCKTCKGAALYCVERFMRVDDRAELARLVGIGYEKVSTTIARAGSVDDCNCKAQPSGATAQSNDAAPAPAPAPKQPSRVSTRPLLTLKRG